MMKTREEKSELKKAEITEHFKKEKRKCLIIWFIFELFAILLSYFIMKLIFDAAYLSYFLISLFFILVFPITMLSKKLKALSKQEREQKHFAEIE